MVENDGIDWEDPPLLGKFFKAFEVIMELPINPCRIDLHPSFV
jgi:hypothetical protein